MLYNTNSVVPSDQLLAAKLKKLAHSPLTASDICQDWPTLRKMSLIGEALKDRILVICTDDSKSDSPPPLLLHQTAVDEDTNEQLNGININNGSAKNIFDLMDSLGALEETWGRRACEELSALCKNEPTIYLPDISEEEFEDEVRVLFGGEMLREGGEVDVWDAEITKKHYLLTEVLDQWLAELMHLPET